MSRCFVRYPVTVEALAAAFGLPAFAYAAELERRSGLLISRYAILDYTLADTLARERGHELVLRDVGEDGKP